MIATHSRMGALPNFPLTTHVVIELGLFWKTSVAHSMVRGGFQGVVPPMVQGIVVGVSGLHSLSAGSSAGPTSSPSSKQITPETSGGCTLSSLHFGVWAGRGMKVPATSHPLSTKGLQLQFPLPFFL